MTAISLLPGQNMALPMGAPLSISLETSKHPSNYEVDSCAFVLGQNGKVRSDADFIFFNQTVFSPGVLQKQPLGHQFIINPQLLPADVVQVVFSLSIYDGVIKKQSLAALGQCHGNIINHSSHEKIAEFTLNTADMSEIALIFFALYLHKGQWKLRALGRGFNGGLDALAVYFGVNVGEDESQPVEVELPHESAVNPPLLCQDQDKNVLDNAIKPAHKRNPVDLAQELYSALMEAQVSIQMAEVPKKKLAEMSEVTKKMMTVLKHIHTTVVPLDLISDDAVFASNLVVWNNLPSGFLFKEHMRFRRLLNNSKTLSTLHKQAIDILSVYKFSDSEIALSKTIGEFFSINHPFFQAFKSLITHNKLGSTYLTARVKEAAEINNFLKNLKKFNIIDPFQIQLFVFNSKEWVDTDIETLKRIRSQENKIRFCINVVDPAGYRELITGHWFNAFTYSIISDHLSRNQLLHEIYTRVSYQSPSEIFKSRGDFDIIAMVGKTILAVECKSGSLKESLDVDTLIDKKRGLERVFESVSTAHYQYLFLMIYNPYAHIQQSVLDKLSEAGIKPLIPSEMRAVIFNIFSAKDG